jgi:hypothetical protein
MVAPQRKPQADIYTVLLVIAFVAIISAIVFLYLETADYGTNKYSGAPPVARVDATDATTSLAKSERGKPLADGAWLASRGSQSLTPESL